MKQTETSPYKYVVKYRPSITTKDLFAGNPLYASIDPGCLIYAIPGTPNNCIPVRATGPTNGAGTNGVYWYDGIGNGTVQETDLPGWWPGFCEEHIIVPYDWVRAAGGKIVLNFTDDPGCEREPPEPPISWPAFEASIFNESVGFGIQKTGANNDYIPGRPGCILTAVPSIHNPETTTGTLSTRNGDDNGIITIAAQPGEPDNIAVGHTVDVVWAAGNRRNMTVTGVAGLAITVDGGWNDILPPVLTAITAIAKNHGPLQWWAYYPKGDAMVAGAGTNGWVPAYPYINAGGGLALYTPFSLYDEVHWKWHCHWATLDFDGQADHSTCNYEEYYEEIAAKWSYNWLTKVWDLDYCLSNGYHYKWTDVINGKCNPACDCCFCCLDIFRPNSCPAGCVPPGTCLVIDDEWTDDDRRGSAPAVPVPDMDMLHVVSIEDAARVDYCDCLVPGDVHCSDDPDTCESDTWEKTGWYHHSWDGNVQTWKKQGETPYCENCHDSTNGGH